MDVSSPISAVSPSLEGKALQVLAHSSVGMTGRQVALLAGQNSHSGVLDALHRLTAQGLVRRVELNRAFLFSLNRNHLAADAVIALAGLRQALVERIRDTVSKWTVAPLHVSMFGSAARGDGDTSSDIDLFVVRSADTPEGDPRWREQLDALAADVESWTGNRASIAEVAEHEIDAWPKSPPAIIEELDREAIQLGGRSLDDVLAYVR